MSGHFSLPGFVRQGANAHLAEYFRRSGIELGVDLAALKRRDTQPILDAINRLSEPQRDALDSDFQKISALGDKAGLLQIRAEARFLGAAIEEPLQGQDSFVNKAFWTWLHASQVFEGAARFAMPHLLGRYWKRQLPLTSAPGADLRPKVDALRDALSRHFLQEEGRGKSCAVEYAARPPLHKFHAYPEDYPAAPLAWLNEKLAPHPYRPAFEVVFIYDDVAGTLDVYFEGGKDTATRLWRLFAEVVLGVVELPEPVKPAFALERLKAPDPAFVCAASSEITDVRLKSLKFVILGGPYATIQLETDVSREPNALQALMDRVFTRTPGGGRIALSQAKVISAKLRATIDPGDGTRPRTLTFDVSEKTCSLKHEGVDLALRRMLIDSGIDQTGSRPDAGAGGAGHTAQLAAE